MDMCIWRYPGEKYPLDDRARKLAPGEFIRLSKGFTHFERATNNKGETVILVPGLSVPYYVWDKTYIALKEEGFSVLRYDLFGRGFSDRVRTHYDIQLFVDQLYEIIMRVDLTTPVNLIGLSFGGIIIAAFTNQHPELVNKLIFIDPAGHQLKKSWLFNVLLLPGLGEITFCILGNVKIFAFFMSRFFDKKDIDEFFQRYLVQMQYAGFRHALLSTMRHALSRDYSSEFSRIGNLEKDVLIVWGKEDKTVPYEHHTFFLEEIPHAELFSVDEAGHIPHHEKHEIVNPKLVSFLLNGN